MKDTESLFQSIRKLEILDYDDGKNKLCNFFFDVAYKDENYVYYQGNIFVGNKKVIPFGGSDERFCVFNIDKEMFEKSVVLPNNVEKLIIPKDYKMPTEYEYLI